MMHTDTIINLGVFYYIKMNTAKFDKPARSPEVNKHPGVLVLLKISISFQTWFGKTPRVC